MFTLDTNDDTKRCRDSEISFHPEAETASTWEPEADSGCV